MATSVGAVKKVVLVGPRAAGKTTLGRALADELSWPFVDGDDMVADAAGQPAEEFLAAAGEEEFRRVEAVVSVTAVSTPGPGVVALGGGAVLSLAVRSALRPASLFVVLLHAPPAVLAARQAVAPRVPLTGEALEDEVSALLSARREHYAAVSDMEVDTSSANVHACLRSIMDKMGHTG